MFQRLSRGLRMVLSRHDLYAAEPRWLSHQQGPGSSLEPYQRADELKTPHPQGLNVCGVAGCGAYIPPLLRGVTLARHV